MKRKFKRSGKFYVYMLECKDGTYYTGYTPDIENRLKLHNGGRGAKYTRDRRPVRLVWSTEYRQFKRAVKLEKFIKTLTRKQKESLVSGIKTVSEFKARPVPKLERRPVPLKKRKKVQVSAWKRLQV